MGIIDRFLRELEETSWIFSSLKNWGYLQRVDPLGKFFRFYCGYSTC